MRTSDWFGRGRDGRRPVVATALFWLGLAGPLAVRPVLDDPRLLPWWVLLTLGVAVLALWPGMSWTPNQALWWRPLAFATVIVAFGAFDGTGLSSPLLLVGLAQLVFAVGAKTAALLTAPTILALGFGIRMLYRESWASTLAQAAAMAVLSGLIIAVLDGIQRERQRSERTEELLDELRVTHAELAARSEQVRQLAISEERARLAREVHDAVGHHLTVVKLNLTNAQRMRQVDDVTAWSDVAEAKRSAADALEEVRRAVRALGPGPLASTDLSGALELLAASYRRPGLDVGLDIRGRQHPMGSVLQASIYRIAEEGLTNVAKHAPTATRADALVYFGDNEVTVSISDDGGSRVEVPEGFGLTGARERVAKLGGRFDVVAEPAGVRLVARIPMTDALVEERV